MSALDEYFAKINRGSQKASSVSASEEKPASNMDAYFAKMGKPSRSNSQNLYTDAVNATQSQNASQTPYADAAKQMKQQSGTNNNFFHGIAGIFEKAAAGAKEGLRTGMNEMGYRAQAAAPLNAADDAYYKAMWEQTTGKKTGVEIPKDTRTQQQKELDEFMGVADLKNDSARAMQRAADKEYERLDNEGLKTAFKRDGTYQAEVDERYADLGPKWQRAMNIAGSVGNQALPILGRVAGTALLGEKGGEALQGLLFFNQASGAAIEESLAEGASWDEALTYGTVIGSIEAATEAGGEMANRMAIKAAGKTLAKGQFTKALIGTLTDSKKMRTILAVLGQMNGEGLEEVASDLVSPFAKSIYNGKTMAQNWMDDVTLQGLWESYLAGAISGGILAGVGGAVNGQFRAQNQNYADETVRAKIEEARTSMKENGVFSSETREKLIDAGTEISALETQQQTAAQEAREHMQMIREMQRALRGDVGAQERLSRIQANVNTAETENAPVSAQRAQNEATVPITQESQNTEGEVNNGQSAYHGEESGTAYVGTRGQAAEGTEGGLQALTGGRTEVQRGVGTDTQADLRQVTPAQLGIQDGGTETVTVVDAQRLGGEAKSAYDAVLANGLEPVAVRGAIQISNGYANAYTQGGKVFFRVDAVDSAGNIISPKMLVQHEMFHNYASEEVIRAADERIRESMTAEEYDAMREAYKADYAGIYDFANMSVEEIEQLLTEEIAADAYAGINWFSDDAPVQEAVRTETERNAPAQRAEAQQETTGPPEGRAQAFVGYDAETGRGIYRSNFEENTPKAKKSERVIQLIQDIWSKNPIDLVVENEDGSKSIIKAEFDPRFDEGENTRSDAAKLAAGNRHGTAAEKRVTLNLADDFYRIIQESTYSGSKAETGKTSATHAGVNMWRYFVNPILYMERSGNETTPYTVSIDVKQKDNGNFVYSFHAERDAKNNGQPAPQTLHAAVNGAENDTANGLPTSSIRSDTGNSQEKSSGRASAAGVQARTADRAALRRAEALEQSGTDNETIRQETGWYRGMDGQWRFEIDDSGMEFRRDGDAQLLKEEGYRRLNELTEKWGKAFENGNNLSDAEMQEMERLQEEYKDAVWEEKYNLRDFVKHDELFKAYPALNRVGLVFDSLPDGVNGYFSKRDNTIALSDSLFGKEPDVVLHEIQHAIQRMEGFTGGANLRYWNDRMEEGFSKRWASGEEMMPSELYRNTAGEIEARDTASRRRMTAEERKNTPPNLGDADTVFADGSTSALSEEVSGINNRTAAELRREYERRMREYQEATRRDDKSYPYPTEMEWIQAAEKRLAELGDGKRRRRTVGSAKRDIMNLFSTDRANRADVERILNRNIGEMMAQGEIRGDALDTLVNELLQTGSVVSNSENSPWIDETYESIRRDMKGSKLYVSKDMWRDFSRDEARELRERAKAAGITLADNQRYTPPDARNMELASKYGEEIFPTDISASDMLRNIIYCAEQGANEKQTLADRLWDEARQEGLGEAREKAYERMVNDLRDKTEVILREFAEDNHLTLKERTKTEAKPISYFDTKKAPVKEYTRKKGDYRPINNLGEYTREIVEMESALETKNAYIIEQGENRFRVKIEEDSGRFYASVYRNGDMIASSSASKRGRLPHWAATEIRKSIGEQISFSPALEMRSESYNADLKAAEEAGYPMFEKKNGEKVQTVPFWTWVRSKERGNYGIVISQTNKTDAAGNRIVEVYYYNKKKGTGKVVGESAETVYAVDGRYSDTNETEKTAARMRDEESEAMRAEEREALWRETQKGSPFEARPNATTDTGERTTKATSAPVQRLFQQLISKGKVEVSTQGENGVRTYTAKMNTNGVEYWVDISDGRQDVQRFREFEKEKAAQLAAEWMDKEANRVYTAANEKRAEARRTELSEEENAKIAELFGDTEELPSAETSEDAPTPSETAESRVTNEIVRAEKNFRENLANVTRGAMRMFVNAGDTVRRIAKQTKNKSLEGYYFNAGAYSQRAGSWITRGGARTDISGHKTGESLMDILGDIMKTPEKYKDFQLMLLHRNNVDRMRYDNKEEIQNLTKCVTTIEDLYPKLRGLDNDYIYQTAVPGDKRDMLSREWKETVLDELINGEVPEIADISEAAQMLIFTRQKISEAKKNGLKPVFGYEVTAYDSQLEAERLLKANPEFDALAKKVYAYFDDLLQYRIDAGLDTQKHVDEMKKRYPNYVPTMRVEGTEGKAARRARRNGGIVVSNAIGRAVGGDAVIMPLHTAMSRKTVAVMKNAGLNQFGEQLVQSWNQDKSIPGINKVELVDYSSTDQYVDSEELYVPVTDNVFSVLRGNDRYNITMDEGLTQAMNAFQPDRFAGYGVAKAMKKLNDIFKAMNTAWSPWFLVKNAVRDFQDAGFYSTDMKTWVKMFHHAKNQIRHNGEIWQQYQALGGSYASMLDYTTGMVKEPKNALGKAWARFELLQQQVEAAPRLAEFMTILANKGGSKTVDGVKTGQFTQSDLMEAMLGAADITTNFARGGSVTKMLNRYLVPFLNPSVQGFDKFIRNATGIRSVQAAGKLILSAAIWGILPQILNELMYHDDDEWDDIPANTKANFYLIKFPKFMGDGYWLKIPKGRAIAVLSTAAVYGKEKIEGEDVKISDVFEVIKSNIAPTDIFNQNIATALTQTKLFNPDNPGTTWYGGNIESDRLQNYRPGERYDEKTDEFSKLIGKTFNLSPKKINYLLDQYTGIFGDILLPLMTPATNAASKLLSAPMSAFTIDTTSTNKTTGEYYDLLDDLKYDANDGDVGAGITRKYVSHAGDEVNDYYAQIRELQNDKNLSSGEKNRLVRALKKQLIERQKEIIEKAEPYREAVDKYLRAHPELSTDNDAAIAEFAEKYDITEDQAESRMDAIVYREINREVFGAEYALRTYNADVYDKARTAYAKGVSYDTYYDYYFATKDMHADKDENGKSISGSKKAKVVEYINSLDIPPEQKDALYIAAGYTEKSARYQKWNGGSGSSGGRRGSSKKTTLKAPTPKAGKIVIPEAGSSAKASGKTAAAKAGGTSKTPKVSGNVIADFTQKSSGTDIRKAAQKAVDTALKVGNRTVTIKGGSPLDYFLKYGKLPSTK